MSRCRRGGREGRVGERERARESISPKVLQFETL